MSPDNVAYIAIELSVTSWVVAARLPGAEKPRPHRIEGGDTAALLGLIAELRSCASAKGGRLAKVVCCFEAGRDGFWLHRLLVAHDITAHILEPTSILVNRRARRAKTDRLDAEGMLRVLVAWLDGDRQVCSMVRVPTPNEEDAKRPHREREHLIQERLRIENRIDSDTPSAPCNGTDAVAEPRGERAAGLIAQPKPGELDQGCARTRVAGSADALVAAPAAAPIRHWHDADVAGELAAIGEGAIKHLARLSGCRLPRASARLLIGGEARLVVGTHMSGVLKNITTSDRRRLYQNDHSLSINAMHPENLLRQGRDRSW